MMMTTIFPSRQLLVCIFFIATYHPNFAMELSQALVRDHKTTLYTDKQTLTVPTRLLVPCAALAMSIESGHSSIQLPAIEPYDLINIAACLQAHYDLEHTPANEQEKAALAHSQLNAQTNKREKLYTALMAANYLGHEPLLAWCQSKWATQKFPVDDTTLLPLEMQTNIAGHMIEHTTLLNDIPGWLAADIWLNPEKTIKHDLGSIWSIAVNRAGTHIAAGDWMGYAHIYTLGSNAQPIMINAHNSEISTIAFTDDDSGIVTCAQDGTIKFWDIESASLRSETPTEHHNAPFVFRTNSNTEQFAYDQGNEVILHSTRDGQLKTLVAHTNLIKDLAFNPAGTQLASCSDDTTIALWDTTSGQCLASLTPHTKSVMCVQFSPDGTLLAAGSKDTLITVHDVASRVLTKSLWGHTKGIWSVIFSHDNQFLFSGAIDGTLKIWHVPSGSLIKNLVQRHVAIHSMCMLPTDTLVTASRHGAITFWNIKKLLTPIWELQRHLARNSTINQACLIDEAYMAPQREPLDCSSKRERIKTFNSLNPKVQALLIKHLHVKSPKKKQKSKKSEQHNLPSAPTIKSNMRQHQKDSRYNRK